MKATHGLAMRKTAMERSEYNRLAYNDSVSQAHHQQAQENARIREANEQRIKALEDMETRMVSDLQKTLQQKNNAMNNLANKSKGLSKAMQPRMAYKYASRDHHSSSTDVLNSNAGSTSPYVIAGRKPSTIDKQLALNIY